jgi:hypothetical protein
MKHIRDYPQNLSWQGNNGELFQTSSVSTHEHERQSTGALLHKDWRAGGAETVGSGWPALAAAVAQLQRRSGNGDAARAVPTAARQRRRRSTAVAAVGPHRRRSGIGGDSGGVVKAAQRKRRPSTVGPDGGPSSPGLVRERFPKTRTKPQVCTVFVKYYTVQYPHCVPQRSSTVDSRPQCPCNIYWTRIIGVYKHWTVVIG